MSSRVQSSIYIAKKQILSLLFINSYCLAPVALQRRFSSNLHVLRTVNVNTAAVPVPRPCTAPSPAGGGRMCQGERTETNDCFLRLCGVREGESKRERGREREILYE